MCIATSKSTEYQIRSQSGMDKRTQLGFVKEAEAFLCLTQLHGLLRRGTSEGTNLVCHPGCRQRALFS